MSKQIEINYLSLVNHNLKPGDVYFNGLDRYFILEVNGPGVPVKAIWISRHRNKGIWKIHGRYLKWLYNKQQVQKKKYESKTEVYGIEYFLSEPWRKFLVKVFRYDFRYGCRTNSKLIYQFESYRWLWINKLKAWLIYRKWKNRNPDAIWNIPEYILTIGNSIIIKTAVFDAKIKVGNIVGGRQSNTIAVVVDTVFVRSTRDTVFNDQQVTVKKFRRHRFAWMNRLHAWWLVKTYKAKS
jgi:hypothetical protein